MLRMNDELRLSQKEKEDLRAISGRPEIPTSVSQYNAQLDVAAQDWASTGCAEGDLLAWMAVEMKVPD